jgi:hemerythrin-like metal-binding protein
MPDAAPKTLWTKDLELGLPLIDGQHRKLVGHLQNLDRAVEQGRPMSEVADCIAFLLEYTEEHFHTEERYLTEKRYPDLEAHRQQHQAFRANVSKAARAVQTRLAAAQSVQLVQSMVVHWYLDHIRGTDQQYVTYLRSKGLLKEPRP